MESLRVYKLLLLLFLTLIPSTAALSCYSRDGVLATSSQFYKNTTSLIACGDESGATTCCLEGQYCTPDLLCHEKATTNSSGRLSRQYCSDPDWPEDKCSAVCPDYTGAGVVLTKCNNAGTKFCCGPSTDCCFDYTYTHIDRKNGRIVAIGTSTIVPSSSATPSPSSSEAEAEAAATATDADAEGGGSDGDGGLSEQAKLGIGLGVGLGVPFLIAIAAALFLWRRSLLSQAQANANANANANGGNGPSSPDEMAKMVSPGFAPAPASGYGYGYGNDANLAAMAAPGTPGREAELENNPVAHQLEAGTNTLSELGDDRRVHELH